MNSRSTDSGGGRQLVPLLALLFTLAVSMLVALLAACAPAPEQVIRDTAAEREPVSKELFRAVSMAVAPSLDLKAIPNHAEPTDARPPVPPSVASPGRATWRAPTLERTR